MVLKGGSIINISSMASLTPIAAGLVYCATKAAVDNITKALAKDLGPKKIRVNSINPGPVETEGTATFDASFFTSMIAQTPLGRVGQPDDIGKIAVFLASDDSAWITGEVMQAAGGL